MASSHNKASRQKKDVTEVIVTDLASALEELRGTEEPEPELEDCFSVEQVCEKLGESRKNAYDIIKDCIANGTCKYAGKRRGKGIDGRTIRTPVYRFKFKNKKRK